MLYALKGPFTVQDFMHQRPPDPGAHFWVDLDGRILQTADLDAAIGMVESEPAIGIQLINPCPSSVEYQEDGGFWTEHPRYEELLAHPRGLSGYKTINDKTLRAFGFTDPQYEGLADLLDTLFRAMPGLARSIPIEGRDVASRAVFPPHGKPSRGVFGLFHTWHSLTSPGPGFDWRRLCHELERRDMFIHGCDVLLAPPQPPWFCGRTLDVQDKQITCTDPRVSNLRPLMGQHQVTDLVLAGTAVADLRPLRGMKGLRRLVLDEAAVYDLDPLRELPGLQVLSLRRTPVHDKAIPQLLAVPTLRTLDLRETSVKDVDPLQEHPELHVLRVAGSRVAARDADFMRAAMPGLLVE